MAKDKEKKADKKTRPDKYEKSTLAINGTFEEVIKASFLSKPKGADKGISNGKDAK
jgi:hypothetical protein